MSEAWANLFGFNRNEDPQDYNTSEQLIRMLVDIVSRGGNLLLNIGPRSDGTIPQIMINRLEDIGFWLERNGEAIYETTVNRKISSGNVKFTLSKNKRYLYLLLLIKYQNKNLLLKVSQDLVVNKSLT